MSAEIDILRGIQQFRTVFLDHFFLFLDFFDSQKFYLLLIIALWQGCGRKIGLSLFYIILINLFINTELKELFVRIRPFQVDPHLGIISASGYSLPSGAAQSYMLLSCLFMRFSKSAWRWPIAISTLLLISFSRLYLGVHYPTDILAGWLVGFTLFLLILAVGPTLQLRLKQLNRMQLFLLSQVAPLTLLLLGHVPSISQVCFTAMGIGFGQLFNDFLEQPTTSRASIGIITTFVFVTLLRIVPFSTEPWWRYFSHFLLGVWLSFFYDWISTKWSTYILRHHLS